MITPRRGQDCPIATFSTRLIATDRIHAPIDRVWPLFADTSQLAGLTPLLASIEDAGDRWRWRMVGITRLGITAAPTFTTLMDVHDTGMRFRPVPGSGEPAAARGEIRVTPAGDEVTEVVLDLTAIVELPLPKMARRAVVRVMDATLRAGGRRFANNLLAALGGCGDDGLVIRTAPVPVS